MTLARLRARALALTESSLFCKVITALILVNAVTLGLETYPRIMASGGHLLKLTDQVILWIFVGELALRLFGQGWRFFRDPWSLFDTAVVLVAFMPATGAFAVLRAARVLRVLRLISIFPKLRTVIEGLVRAIPGIGSIGAILAIIYYVFAVMATKLFGGSHPEWFGSLQASMFSLFQIMTLEGWADMVRTVAAGSPYAVPFFIVYILVATFTVLNLFIAVIVDAMQRTSTEADAEELRELKLLRDEISRLSAKVDAMTKANQDRMPASRET